MDGFMEKPKCTIFYSWQSDLESKTNRSFIEDALKRVVKAIKNDDSIQVEPVLDRDTKNVPGSPDIARAIFVKIKTAQVFICDASIINQGEKCLTPNPNVIAEWGYALALLGEERIITVLNTAYGKPDDLPFDMRPRRAISYCLPKGTEEAEGQDRAAIRRDLEHSLRLALLAIFKMGNPQPVKVVSCSEKAIIAIRDKHRDELARVHEYMKDLAAKIQLLQPTDAQDILDEQLVQAINVSTTLAAEFAQVVKLIAEVDAREATQAIYEGFTEILNLYTVPPGQHREIDTFVRDLAKFLGYELFIMFVALLLQNKRWALLATLLDEEFYARTSNYAQPAFVPFTALCQPVALLYQRNERLELHTSSLQGNLLCERHTEGNLANIVPIEQFIEADYFLFLRDLLKPATKPKQIKWRAWSTISMTKPASFLQKAARSDFAEQLTLSLGLPDVPTLRSRLAERQNTLTNMWTYGSNTIWFDPLEQFDIDSIGSR